MPGPGQGGVPTASLGQTGQAAQTLASSVSSAAQSAGRKLKNMFGFEHGGKVEKTGMYMLHAGETIVPEESLSKRVNKDRQEKFRQRHGVKE